MNNTISEDGEGGEGGEFVCVKGARGLQMNCSQNEFIYYVSSYHLIQRFCEVDQ